MAKRIRPQLFLDQLGLILLTVLAAHMAIWAVDLSWEYRIKVELADESIDIRDNCWPSIRTRWAPPNGETFDQCWTKVENLKMAAEEMSNWEPYSEQWMIPTIEVVKTVAQHGDAESVDALFTALCPFCRADHANQEEGPR